MLGSSFDNIILQERRKGNTGNIYWADLPRYPSEREMYEARLILKKLARLRDLG